MTWAEYMVRVEGYWKQEEEEWDRTRRLAVTIINMNVAKRSDRIDYKDWLPLPKDSKKINIKPKSSVKEFEEAKRKLRDAYNSGISSTVNG